MKNKKFITFCTMLTLIFGTLPLSLMGCKNNNKFDPVLRFTIASDVHIADSGSNVEEARLKELFNLSYRYANRIGSKHKTLDAVVFAGDFTNLGTLTSMQKFKSIVDENVKPETKVMVSLGNHEFYTDAQTTEDRYKSVFNTDVDEHFVVAGFHFIKLSPNGDHFGGEKLLWLKEELKKAALDTPNLPIFVIQHQHVKNTVYGSTGWGVDGLYEILAEYPQVVDFSGHSHFPIQDERSLWQGDFTAIGTGTLSYVEMGLNGVSSDYVFPHGKVGDYKLWNRSNDSDYGVFQIVECDKAGNIRIIGYDLTSESCIFERRVNTPTNKNSFITNEDKKSTSPIPEFSIYNKCSYKVEESGDILLTVPQAKSKSFVESYRAEVYCNNKLFKTFYALSGQIFVPYSPKIYVRLTNLEVGKEYNVKVYAVNSYGVSSTKPLEIKICN